MRSEIRFLAAVAVFVAGYGSALAQSTGTSAQQTATPPIPVTTPDVKTPAPLVLPSPAAVVAGSQPLTVDEAVAIALAKQPLVGIARANLTSAAGRVQQAASGLYPQLGASAGFNDQRVLAGSAGGNSGASSGNSGLNRFTASVNVQQLLFDFGRTRDQVRQQNALERATSHTLDRTQETVALQVKLAFYDLAQNLDNVAFSEANFSNRQKELDQAHARVASGLGAPSDEVQAKTNLADSSISLSSARDSALASQVSLAQLLGIDPRTPITPATGQDSPAANEVDLQALVATALDRRPDILSAREQVTAAHYALTSAQKGNLPRIGAAAAVNGRGPNDPFPTQTLTYGINVTWTFDDGGLTAGKVREARGNEEAARQNLIQVSNQAVADVSLAFVDLQSAQQRRDAAEVEVANATELVRISEGRYSGGIGQFLDVTNAQNSLFGAQRNLTQAQEDVRRARARLVSDVGGL